VVGKKINKKTTKNFSITTHFTPKEPYALFRKRVIRAGAYYFKSSLNSHHFQVGIISGQTKTSFAKEIVPTELNASLWDMFDGHKDRIYLIIENEEDEEAEDLTCSSDCEICDGSIFQRKTKRKGKHAKTKSSKKKLVKETK